MPYNFGSHWCLVVLDIEKETFQHFDPFFAIDSLTRANEVKKESQK